MEFTKIKLAAIFLALAVGGLGWFFIFYKNSVSIDPKSGLAAESAQNQQVKKFPANEDIEPQKPLIDPPQIIKAVYLTGWSGGSDKKINEIIDLKKTTGLNAVVIDIKDYSGYISYEINLPQIDQYDAKEVKIKKVNTLIKKLHDNGIYVIARITVFQDPVLAKARPDLAVKKKENASSTLPYPTWYDNKGLAWVDPASKEVWDYNVAIAKDAAARGFDELNFDYIRFPSDGDMQSIYFSFWDQKISKQKIISGFFKYLRESLAETKISADIFGLVTINKDDLGIGQVLEDVYKYFDFICPMVYPSHYYSGTLNFTNPAEHPYEVVKYSIDEAVKRLANFEALEVSKNATSTAIETPSVAIKPQIMPKIRPWLQDFNLGAVYTLEMVRAQIKAVSDSLGQRYNGFMLWNPSNKYTKIEK